MTGHKRTVSENCETPMVGARPPAPDQRLQLVVMSAEGHAVHPLPLRGPVTLGRSSQNDVQVLDASISRAHAVIELGPTCTVRDLGSANGVQVRGQRLAPGQPAEVTPGEPVVVGHVVVVLEPASTDARGRAPAARAGSGPAAREVHGGGGDDDHDDEPAAQRVDAREDVVADPAMRRLVALAERVARSDISVLLLGETGVGKEVFAARIHRASPRAARPFVALHCAALAPSLLESELFGHEKGAFTGADQAKPGLFEAAAGGTVLLDEVGELPPGVQVKLLRVLESREVTRVGGLKPRALDVRFIAATNRDLRADVAAGTFRQDLFYRLNGFAFHIPPLRERRADIAPLARRFAARAAAALGASRAPELAPELLAALAAYDWPGNVRELRNVVERAVVASGGDAPVRAVHLPPELARASEHAGESAPPAGVTDARATWRAPAPSPPAPAGGALREDLDALERQRILDALAKCGGNQTRAAELLGIPRRTLTRRLERYQVPRPRGGS